MSLQDFGDSPADLAEDVCATGALTPSPTVENQPPQFYSGVVSGPSFCANLSLGGPKTYPFDSNGDGMADVCSLPYTRREAIARQNALQKLAQRFVADSNLWLVEACAALRAQNADFGDNPADLANDACAKPTPTDPPGGGGGGGGGGVISVAPSAPDAPTGVTVTAGHQSLLVSWTAPNDNRGAVINDYDVQYRIKDTDSGQPGDQPGPWLSMPDSSNSAATSITISDSTNGTHPALVYDTAYQVQVRAGNSIGNSTWAPATPVDGTPTAQAPDAPTGVTVTAGHQSLLVSWTAPNDNRGAVINDYDVRYRIKDTDSGQPGDQPGPWLSMPDSSNSAATSITISDSTNGTHPALVNDTAYQVQVQAGNSVGDSTWAPATPVDGTPTAQAPDAPTGVTVTPGEASLAVSWTAPANNNGAAVDDYDVRYRIKDTNSTKTGDQPGTWLSMPDSSKSTTTSITISDSTNGTHPALVNDTAYQVQVRAGNSIGNSTWAPATPVEGTPTAQAPDAPTGVTVTAGHQSLLVSWTAPNDNRGAVINDYDVRYRIKDTDSGQPGDQPGPWLSMPDSSNSAATSITISDSTNGTHPALVNDTAYQVQVQAGNSVGDSTWAPATPVDGTPTAQAPDAPTGVTVTARNLGLFVSWTAPGADDPPVSNYKVRYRIKDTDSGQPGDQPGPWLSMPDSSNSAATSITISDSTNGTHPALVNDTAYQVQVRAGNSIGNSTWAPATPVDGTPAPQAPDAPTGVTVTPGEASLAVSWTAPANNNGAAVDDYDVRYRIKDTNSTKTGDQPGTWLSMPDSSKSTTTSLTISDATNGTHPALANGTAYQVQVRAGNSPGDSTWGPVPPTSPVYGTPRTNPSAPQNLRLECLSNGIVVRWDASTSDGGAPPVTYKVSWRANPGAGWAVVSQGTVATSYTHTGATSSAENRYHVKAVNNAGLETLHTQVGDKWFAYANLSDRPTLATSSISGGVASLSASWSFNAGTSLTDYDVNYRIKDTDSNQTGNQPGAWIDHPHTGTATTTTISQLNNGTAYEVRVRGISRCSGPWSDNLSATTTAHADRKTAEDYTLKDGNHDARGIWSDGTTMWVADYADKKIYAYKMSDKSRDSAKDFTLAYNQLPFGIWSDGTTMWISHSSQSTPEVIAYKMSDKTRDSAKDFTLTDNENVYGIWSDGTTMWTSNQYDYKIFAYKMSDKSRDSAKDITLVSNNTSSKGIWSDGTTMWVFTTNNEIYAYKMSDKSRDSAKDITPAGGANTDGEGIWSDGTTMWVSDHSDNKLYAYHLVP